MIAEGMLMHIVNYLQDIDCAHGTKRNEDYRKTSEVARSRKKDLPTPEHTNINLERLQ